MVESNKSDCDVSPNLLFLVKISASDSKMAFTDEEEPLFTVIFDIMSPFFPNEYTEKLLKP